MQTDKKAHWKHLLFVIVWPLQLHALGRRFNNYEHDVLFLNKKFLKSRALLLQQ